MSHTKVFKSRAWRASFAHRWARFLRAHYESPEDVSVQFAVRYQTAKNWWDGASRPSGDVVDLAVRRHGLDYARFMDDAS